MRTAAINLLKPSSAIRARRHAPFHDDERSRYDGRSDDAVDLVAGREFKLESGNNRRLDAILERSPYGMDSVWSSWDDAISEQARDATGVR